MLIKIFDAQCEFSTTDDGGFIYTFDLEGPVMVRIQDSMLPEVKGSFPKGY